MEGAGRWRRVESVRRRETSTCIGFLVRENRTHSRSQSSRTIEYMGLGAGENEASVKAEAC